MLMRVAPCPRLAPLSGPLVNNHPMNVPPIHAEVVVPFSVFVCNSRKVSRWSLAGFGRIDRQPRSGHAAGVAFCSKIFGPVDGVGPNADGIAIARCARVPHLDGVEIEHDRPLVNSRRLLPRIQLIWRDARLQTKLAQ